MQTVTQELAERLAFHVHEAPARYQHVIAALLDEALDYVNAPRGLRARLDHPYICRACERAGTVERFEELGDLIAHRRAHAAAELVPAEERRPVMAAVIALDSRRRFGRAARLAHDDMPAVSTEICP